MKRLSSALVVALALVACRPKELPSDARIQAGDAGHATLAIEGVSVELPDGEAEDGAPVMRNEAGRLLSYKTKTGSARVLYRIGNGLFLGPTVTPPVDYAAVPDVSRALPSLWEDAKTKERRLAFASELEREKGAGALIELLAATAPLASPGWDELRARVPTSDALKKAFAQVLTTTAPLAIARAARIVDLGTFEPKELIGAKAHELGTSWKEPRTAAVLLRTVLARDPNAAGKIACASLAKRPKTIDDPEDALLAEADYLVLAQTNAECTDKAKYLEQGLDVTDHPSFRCNADGPLGWRTESKQDEPLCTKEQATQAVAASAKRPPADVFTATEAKAELVAYAAILAKGSLPPAFLKAHERRRYVLVQPKTPNCENETTAKTPCACDEATVRQHAATNAAGHIIIGVCEFDVDDAQKKITNVLRFNP